MVGSVAVCKGRDDGDTCEYSPNGLFHNRLFSYSHEQQQKTDIREVIQQRGFYDKDFHRMLVIKNRLNKVLPTDFLNLPDIFDGGVSTNDFPVTVYLQETWKGVCWKGAAPQRMCAGVRRTLLDACEGSDKDASCTYKSLQFEKKRLWKELELNFEGQCETSTEGAHWCKLSSTREQQIEACLGKLAGKNCEYSGKFYNDVYKGRCMGSTSGTFLQCHGAQGGPIEACEGKVLGNDCVVKGDQPEMPWEGWCAYSGMNLQCTLEKKSPPTPMPPVTTPMPPVTTPMPSGDQGGECSALKKEVTWMKGVLVKIAAKMGLDGEPSKPSNRRRSGLPTRRRRRAKP